jgi:cell volume regulation protein A
VLLTAALTAPVAKYLLGMSWTEALLVGAVVASTDAAAVFFLIHAGGLRLRPRVGATLEVESGSKDPFAVLLTIILVEFLTVGDRSWQHVLAVLAGRRARHRHRCARRASHRRRAQPWLALAQGLHAPFVATSALVILALPRRCTPGLPRRLSCRSGGRQSPRAPTTRWWCFSMP